MIRRLLLVAVAGAALAGCVRVQPWQRGDLARRSMTAGFGDTGVNGHYQGKVLETKAGGGAAKVAPGGGCGCSQ